MKILVFDMDGTLNDLYGYPDWLQLLRDEDTTPYRLSEPLVDMIKLNELLETLRERDYKIGVVTWYSMTGTAEYNKATRQAKLDWLTDYDMPLDFFHGVKYGTTKANTIRNLLAESEEAILFDDNAKIRKGWNYGRAIDPTETDIIDFLTQLLAE